MTLFQITRTDGRSNAQVILDFVRGDEPGTEYSYKELSAELSKNTDRTYGISAVRSVVMQAYPRLLREQQRALHNVRGRGYRLAHASQHKGLALVRKRRADRQLLRGVQTLENVKWDELTEAQRAAHEGTLMVVGALWQAQSALERRQNRVESVLDSLKNKQS